MHSDEENSKAIILSSNDKLLKMVRGKMTDEGLVHKEKPCMLGSPGQFGNVSIMQAFKLPKENMQSVNYLFMKMQHCNMGLDFDMVKHVFILEPCCDETMIQQAKVHAFKQRV